MPRRGYQGGMQRAVDYQVRRGRAARRRAQDFVARLLAVSALLLAVYVVLAVVTEAREPSSAGVPASRPLPPSLLGP
jgi:hypothetical protein